MALFCTYYDSVPPGLPNNTAVRIVARVFPTQALATAGGATDGETAYVGAVGDEVKPGWFLITSTSEAGNISEGVPAGVISANTARKRAAARRVHQALIGWTAALTAEGIAHPASVVAIGHDFLFRAHQATYLVFRNGARTAARLEGWATQMAMGAADVTSPAEFFRRMETGLAAPNGPCAWVDFGGLNGVARRVNLAQAQARSRAATAQGGLGLDAAGTGLPADGLSADGSWIDSLT